MTARLLAILILSVTSWASIPCETLSAVDVKSSGYTVLSLPSDNISVTLHSHSVNPGNPPEDATGRTTNCTFTYNPCVLLDNVVIKVKGTAITVPRSVFMDLGDVKYARVKKLKDNTYSLTLQCGQASETYLMIVTFSANQILHRTVASDLDPSKVLEKTVYHQVTIGD